MALKSKNKVSANFNMSSMTDIVFLLLKILTHIY